MKRNEFSRKAVYCKGGYKKRRQSETKGEEHLYCSHCGRKIMNLPEEAPIAVVVLKFAEKFGEKPSDKWPSQTIADKIYCQNCWKKAKKWEFGKGKEGEE